MTQDPRSRSFEALAKLLVSDDSLADALTSVLGIVAEAVPSAQHAGLTIGDAHGRPATPIYTDPDVPDMDQAQYDSGRGPCLDAWRRNTVIRLDHLAEAPPSYPEFARAATRHGILSTLSVPLAAGSEAIGALNLYSREPAGFTEDDEGLVGDLTPAAGAFIANAQAYWHAFDLTEQLNQALTSRSVIDRAIGMVMAADPKLDPDAAFEVLRRASQRENVKVRDVARRMVDRRLGPREDEDTRNGE